MPKNIYTLNELKETIVNEISKEAKTLTEKFSENDNEEKSKKIDSDIDGIEKDLKQMTAKSSELYAENETLMLELERFEAAQQDIGQLRTLKAEELKIVTEIDTGEQQLTGYLSNAWFLPLSKIIESKNESIIENLKLINEYQQTNFTLNARISELRTRLSTNKCSSCGSQIDINATAINNEITQNIIDVEINPEINHDEESNDVDIVNDDIDNNSTNTGFSNSSLSGLKTYTIRCFFL